MALPVNVDASRLTRSSNRRLARWNQLCTTLGSIECLKTAKCRFRGPDASSLLCYLLPRLQQVSFLFINVDLDEQPSDVAKLVAGLDANPRLKELELNIPLISVRLSRRPCSARQR